MHKVSLCMSFLSYLCPWAAVPHGCWHTGTSITGLHLCRFVPNTLPSSFTLSDPSSSQTHHLSPLHPGATLGRTLREHKVEDHVENYYVAPWMLAPLRLYVSVNSQCWTSRWSTSWSHRVPCCTPHFPADGAWSCTPCHSPRCLDRWCNAHLSSSSLLHSPLSTVIDRENERKHTKRKGLKSRALTH